MIANESTISYDSATLDWIMISSLQSHICSGEGGRKKWFQKCPKPIWEQHVRKIKKSIH